MWDAFQWISAAQVKYLREFVFSIGSRFQELEPDADLVSPDKDHNTLSYDGWAYCARAPDKSIFLAYFEKGMPRACMRGARLNTEYRAQWFDPRNGSWQSAGSGVLRSGPTGIIDVPDYPGDSDWGLKLTVQ